MTVTHAPRWQDAADSARRIGHAVEAHGELPSTNDRARDLLAAGAEGVAVVADLQTAGRGRRGRTWLSPPGRNLACSVALQPRVGVERAGLIGLAAALAVLDASAPWAELWLRWPNDVVAAGGAKVAGILVETALEGDRVTAAIIGIGINVNWRRGEMPPEIAGSATSLIELAGEPVDRVALLARLLAALDREMAALEAGDSPVARATAASALRSRRVVVDLGDRRIAGSVDAIDAAGQLVIDTGVARVALAHGEVVRVEPIGDPAVGLPDGSAGR
jgi:BirA family biotin operon repressor/biotin-[acetyl-CoA-carboxylase] ligase